MCNKKEKHIRKWGFPPNNNGPIVGINNAGVATFSTNYYESLVREAIQNSLDAKLESYDGPVEVHFDQLKISTDRIPGRESLDEAFVKCSQVKTNDVKTTKFFEDAHTDINRSEIYVLKVSDYHTIGLKGSSSGEMGTSWSKLVKESGTTNKSGDAGGSFGIGKSAYFACSKLRTVFFSSLSEDGEKSSIGVSWLITFDIDEKTKSQGFGYYSPDDLYLAFQELADFDGQPLRDQSGTDVYIIGNYISDDGMMYALIDYVIANFMVSIVKEKLVVKVCDQLVDAAFVEEYFRVKSTVDRKLLDSDMVQLLDYYRILTNADGDTLHIVLDSEEYGKQFGFEDGECELYLRKSPELNRKILLTRKTGMKIREQNNISGSIVFSGVLYMSGLNMNKMFRDMEGPAHNKWEANQQAANYLEQKEALRKFKQYLKQQVVENFADKIGDEFDAFDVGDFLPDSLETPADSGMEVELTLQNKKVKVSKKDVKPTKRKVKSPDPIKEIEEEESPVGVISGEVTGTGDGPGIGSLHGGSEGGGIGTGTGDGEGNGIKPGDGDRTLDGEEGGEGSLVKKEATHYKENEKVSKRAICLSPEAGLYKISVRIPNKAKHAKLNISLAAEQSDFDLNVLNVGFSGYSGKAVITGFSDNTIFLENLAKNELLSLAVVVEFNGYCMMEVDYYESKK